MATETNYAPVCGTYCGSCPFLDKQCPGCGNVNGKPFWTGEIPGKVCPLHGCCRNQKKLDHCGLCGEFPCTTFLELRDPNMTEDEFQQSLEMRRRNLNRRTRIGKQKWLLEMISQDDKSK